MKDVTRSSQFIANSRKVYDKHIEVFFQTFQFLLFFSSNSNLISSMRGRIHFLVFQEIINLLILFITMFWLLDNMQFLNVY